MVNYYTKSASYYRQIDYTADTWTDESQLEARDILTEAARHEAVIEIGCGRANILKTGVVAQRRYTGCDFSRQVMEENRRAYPEATFLCIEDVAEFPVPAGSYDYVFSHYVLEHCVFPNRFLDECVRVLKPGGTLSILCPDFLGTGRMSSQRSGFSPGTGREKLARRKLLDALVTGFDNKLRIPLYACWLRALAGRRPGFYINLQPTCFTDAFSADVDAVYLTFADEIRAHLAASITWHRLPEPVRAFSASNAHIYLKGVKCQR